MRLKKHEISTDRDQRGKMTRHPYRLLTRYICRQWRLLLAVLACTAVLSALTALQPWPLKIVVDYALGASSDSSLSPWLDSLQPTPTTLILGAALASLALFALSGATDFALTWAWCAAGQRMVCDLAADLFARLQRRSMLQHQKATVGDALSRLAGDTYCVYTVTQALLVSPWRDALTLVAVGAVAWRLDAHLTALTLLMAPLLGGSALFFGPRLKRKARTNREAQSRLLTFVHQTLSVTAAVQAFGSEERNRRHFDDLAADVSTRSQHGILVENVYGLLNTVITTLGGAVVLYAGGTRVLSGKLSVGTLLVFVAYLRSLEDASKNLLATYGMLRSTDASVDRVREVLETGEGVRDERGATPLVVARPARGATVCLEEVTFGYETGRPVLKEISIEAQAGETVALVGPTGAGKSTLVSLIPRFFDPWQGRVVVAGRDVRRVQLASLRVQIAVVLQEAFLLPLSIAENIAYGRPDASPAEVRAAAAAANADEFIRRLPDGYDTIIGERGATLSGGEKQRLAIARALLKDAPILIMDEPTAALDAHTEASVLEAIERLQEGRTTFVIAHRLSTVRHADRIAIIENGRISAIGSHPELLATSGSYRRFHALQSPTALAGAS